MALVSLMELIALTKPSPVAAYLNRNAQGLKAESLGALTPLSLVPTAPLRFGGVIGLGGAEFADRHHVASQSGR